MRKLDNIHYSFRAINGYPQIYKFVMSCREPGKTTNFWLDKYNNWVKTKRPVVMGVRQIVDISEEMIRSIQETTINAFIDETVEFTFKFNTLKTGVTDVFIDGVRFIRIMALCMPLQRIKKLRIMNAQCCVIDEYICDPRNGEKYLTNEAFRIKEWRSTIQRDSDTPVPLYILGNPYSLFNPLFVDWKVDVNELLKKRGGFLVGQKYVIQWYLMTKELREYILERNPDYKFDEDYQQYAVEGLPKNDKDIKVAPHPNNYSLRFCLRYGNIFIGIFQNNDYDEDADKYYCEEISEISAKRVVYCFDFENLIDKTQLMSLSDRTKLSRFKDAMAQRKVSFQSINIYYFMEEVYRLL